MKTKLLHAFIKIAYVVCFSIKINEVTAIFALK